MDFSGGEEAGQMGTEAEGHKQAETLASLLVLTILPVVAGPTLAGVPSRSMGGAHTGCHMLAGVQETCVHTLFSKVPCGDRIRITSMLLSQSHTS